MPRKRAAALVALVGAAVTAAGSAAPARDALIRPGVGIGKVRLGMTLAQVKAVRGRHDTGWSEQRAFGRRYLELAWGGGAEDHFAVGLLGRPGALRVVSITTTQRRERTAAGFGPGSSRRELIARIRGLRCRDVYRVDGSGHIVRTEILLPRPAGTAGETAFVPGNNVFRIRDTTKTIAYVVVRRPGVEPELRSEPVPCRA